MPSLRTSVSRSREPLGDGDRQRHQLRGVVAGVAEHQALVAGAALVELVLGGADPRLVAVVDARGDVGRTGRRWRPGRRRCGRRSPCRRSRSRSRGSSCGRARRPGRRRRADLTGDDDEAGGQQRLDGDAQVGLVGVVRHQVVEDRVADRVGDLVGVTLGHGLGGEQASGHVCYSLSFGWIESGVQTITCATSDSRDARLSRASRRRDLVPDDVGERGLGPARAPRRRRRRRPRTTASLSALPKTAPPLTSLTTSRSQPLRASLARPWSSTEPVSSPVSAANPTMTVAGAGPVVGDLGEDVGVLGRARWPAPSRRRTS